MSHIFLPKKGKKKRHSDSNKDIRFQYSFFVCWRTCWRNAELQFCQLPCSNNIWKWNKIKSGKKLLNWQVTSWQWKEREMYWQFGRRVRLYIHKMTAYLGLTPSHFRFSSTWSGWSISNTFSFCGLLKIQQTMSCTLTEIGSGRMMGPTSTSCTTGWVVTTTAPKIFGRLSLK